MPLISDGFTRTGALAGSATEVGDATWQGSGSISANRLVLPASTSAWVTAGSGDADLSVTNTGGYYAGVFVRGSAAGAGGWRLENYAQNFSSGGYVSVPQYTATYQLLGCENAYTYATQCNNSNFTSMYSGTCYLDQAHPNNYYTAYLQSVSQNGTCQVYQSSSYTVSYSRLINPAGQQVWSGQTAYAPVMRIRAQGSSVTAWVGGTQVWTGTDADTTSRTRSTHGLYATANDQAQFDAFTLDTLNTPPNAPIIAGPANNSVVDRTQVITLDWTFNDPDPTDRQSRFDLQVRKVGDPSWVSTSSETPTTSFDYAAGSFADGAQYEWQVRTYDSQGIVGPWSSTSYFRAGTPPPAPTWLDPVNGGQIPTEQFNARWSSASQVLYELQVLPEVNGAANTAAPTYASGPVRSTARQAALTFPNNVVRYLRVRIQAGDLWSPWATVRATVAYTPPAIPVVLVLADDLQARILVDVRTPKPTGTQPAVQFLDLYRQAGSEAEQRVAAAIAPGGRWIDWTPASGVEHRYRAVAYGANGVTSTSAPTA